MNKKEFIEFFEKNASNELADYARDALYLYEDTDELDIDNAREKITEHIIESAQVIYSGRALDYLAEHDPSLIDSLTLAQEYGYTLDKLNSEILATILLQQNLLDELGEIMDELEKEK